MRKVETANLQNLKSLKTEIELLTFFINDVKKLEKFKIYGPFRGTDNIRKLADFMNQQENLQELVYKTESSNVQPLALDITRGMNFKLKKFSMLMSMESENISEFLETQIEDLEELELNHYLKLETLDVIL